MSNDEHVFELLEAYALGALTSSEAEQVDRHVAGCASCGAELRAIEAVTNDLPLALAEASPPPALQQKLMARIEEPAREAEIVPKPSYWEQITAVFQQNKALAYSQLVLLALVILLLGSTVLLWQQVNEMNAGPEPGRLLAVHLNSTGIIPEAEGYITISADGLSGAIVLDRVPQLGADQIYQLWLVQDDRRTSAAQLDVDELGYGGGRVRVPESLFNYGWAEVTVEPVEGSVQPTSEVILRAPLFP